MDTCQIFFLNSGAKNSRNQESHPSHNAMTTDGVMHLPREQIVAKVYDLQTVAAMRKSGSVYPSAPPLGIDGRV
jgi:hypothetical protein